MPVTGYRFGRFFLYFQRPADVQISALELRVNLQFLLILIDGLVPFILTGKDLPYVEMRSFSVGPEPKHFLKIWQGLLASAVICQGHACVAVPLAEIWIDFS